MKQKTLQKKPAWSDVQIEMLRGALLAWYDAHKRTMPWRDEVSAYRTVVSEVMLQQTQVSVVVDYFTRWMARFPTVDALAAAPIDDVLSLWSGLGYYRRAHNLHALAQAVMQQHGGQFPTDFEQILALPGVGRYTAGAVASIALGQKKPLVDGNVARVLCRMLAIEGDPTSGDVQKKLWEVAEALVDEARPGDFNQGLMELGATLCTKAQPRCSACPWANSCEAKTQGRQAELPQPKKKPKRQQVEAVCLWLETHADQGRQVLLVQRPLKGLWSGLWELPTLELARGPVGERRAEVLSAKAKAQVEALAKDQLGLAGLDTLPPLRPQSVIEQTLTHLDWLLVPWQGTLPPGQAPPQVALAQTDYIAWRWCTWDTIPDMGLSRLTRRVFRLADPE